MTPEEFKSLKTGTADPVKTEHLLQRCLIRLNDLEEMKKRGRTFKDPRQTDKEWSDMIDTKIDEYILSVHRNDNGSIQPTHYYG